MHACAHTYKQKHSHTHTELHIQVVLCVWFISLAHMCSPPSPVALSEGRCDNSAEEQRWCCSAILELSSLHVCPRPADSQGADKLNTRSVNNVKCDTLTSITSELPTAGLEWFRNKGEPRTRDLVSVLPFVGCSLSASTLLHSLLPKLSFLSLTLQAAVFCQVGSKALSDHSCFMLAKFVFSQHCYGRNQ